MDCKSIHLTVAVAMLEDTKFEGMFSAENERIQTQKEHKKER